METIFTHINFYVYVILMMIGMWAMIAKNNLIKKLIGMSIFQTAIILFFVSLGVKTGEGTTIPVLEKEKSAKVDSAAAEQDSESKKAKKTAKKNTDPDHYANPLPHVLMLTAIVVGVATLGVALAISQHVFHDYETLEEDEILEKIRNEHG